MEFICGKRGVETIWEGEELKVKTGKTRGGAVFVIGKDRVEISGKFFFMNHVQMDGGGVYLLDCQYVTIRNCLFLMNFAKWGGGVYLERCAHIKIFQNQFIGNYAKRDGGAISLSGCTDIEFGKNHYWMNIGRRSCKNIDLHHCSGVKTI